MSRLYEDQQLREQICDWLRANDIDPGTVPMGAVITVSDGKVTFPEHVRNEDGRLQKDPSDYKRLLTRYATKPLLVEPDGPVRLWLAPRCPTCGR